MGFARLKPDDISIVEVHRMPWVRATNSRIAARIRDNSEDLFRACDWLRPKGWEAYAEND